MTTLTHHHNYGCHLKADLGVDHDTPLIEWHDWAPAAIADPDEPSHVEAVSGGTPIVQALPVGAVQGGLVIITASSYGGGTNVYCDDPRVEQIAGELDFRVWAGHLYDQDDGTAWDDPFTLYTTGGSIRLTANIAAYQGGVTWGEVSPQAGSASKDIPVPVLSDVGAVAVIARAWETLIAGTYIFQPVPYLFEGLADIGKTRTAIFHWSNGGTLGSNPSGNFTADGDSGFLQLHTIELKRAAAGPGGLFEWVLNDERTDALVDYSVNAGRPTPMGNTDALNAGVRLARFLTDAIPATGDRFRITLNADVAAALGVPEAERPRFTGEITDLDVDARGDLSVVTISALGRRARLNRLPVVVRRPEELDGERVRRILYQARRTLPLLVGTIEHGTVTLLDTHGADSAPAQQLIDQVSVDSLGQLVEHRSGRLDYHDASHRRGRTSSLTLTGEQHLIQPFTWRQSIASVINDATATFGPDDDRQEVRVVDPESANPNTGAGPYGAQLDTRLAGPLDAYALLTNLVGRYARPSWWLPSVLVELYRTAGDQLADILQLGHGDKITATDLPPDGAFTAGDVFVEGTSETHSTHSWSLSLAVADPALAGAGLRWIDLPRFLRWVDVDPDLTWLDVATLTDPYDLGRPVADGGDGVDALEILVVDGGDGAGRDWHYDYILEGQPS